MVISYPTPAYSNPPIESQFYQPGLFFIEDITLGHTTTITTTEDNNYVIGQEVRLLIPPGFGCRQLNGIPGFVIDIPASDEVVLDIYSASADPFMSDPDLENQPQIIAIGDINSGIISSTGRSIPTTNIPGSFINISPE